jgi:superfamily II DNA or RNA helicase
VEKRYKHQEEFLKKNPDKYLLVWGCGTGKTRSAIEWADTKGKTLVVVPKGLVLNWEREILKWSSNIANFEVMTKETFRKFAKELPRFEAVIMDEAHFFAGMKPISLMSKNMLAYIKKQQVRYVLGLTATPYLSKAWNIFRLAKILGYEWNYFEFKSLFYNDVRMGHRLIEVPKAGVEALLGRWVSTIGEAKELEDCVDVPESTFTTEYFALTKEQEKKKLDAYDSNPIVRYTREHQICGGTLKGNDFTQGEVFEADKRQRVFDLAHEHDRLIVVCRYRLEIEALHEGLTKLGFKVYVITGDTEERDTVLQETRKEPKSILLVSSGCSEGWEYPECTTMIFYSYDFSLKNYIQMLGRIQRINDVRKRLYLSLVLKGSIDEDVFNSILKKRDFHMHIYAQGK